MERSRASTGMARLRSAAPSTWEAVARTIRAPEEDDRDWDAIDRFAGEMADQLLRAHLATQRCLT